LEGKAQFNYTVFYIPLSSRSEIFDKKNPPKRGGKEESYKKITLLEESVSKSRTRLTVSLLSLYSSREFYLLKEYLLYRPEKNKVDLLPEFQER
jgi:hypothetical protein